MLDGTLGRSGAVQGPNYSITEALGRRVGSNVFHSFRTFNVGTGQTATFSGAPGTSNVIARVTGGPSSIDGTVRSTIAGANFYLINPQGVVFGRDAQLDVRGSFYASTASHLKLGSAGRFDAVDPAASVLTADAPSAFGFLGTPAAISVNRSLLVLQPGATLALVGGDLFIKGEGAGSGNNVWAPSGRIYLASVASAGDVRLGSGGISTSAPKLGQIRLDKAVVTTDVQFDPAGPIFIRGGRLQMQSSIVSARNEQPGAPGADLHIRLSGDLAMDGGSILRSSAIRGADAGNATVLAMNITMKDGSIIETSSADRDRGLGGRAGSTTIEAGGDVELSGGSAITSITLFGLQPAGDLKLRARTLTLREGSNINVATFGDGAAGNVVLDLGGLALHSGGHVLAGALFDSRVAPGSGPGGNIAVDAAGLVDIDGQGSGLFSVTNTFGNGGTITLRAANLRIAANGRISSASTDPNGIGADGNAGSIRITATEAIALESGGSISTEAVNAGGGIITLRAANSLSLSDASITTSVADGAGNGGDINIDPVFVTLNNSRIIAQAVGGNGGDITIVTQFILADPGSLIDASSQFGLSGQVIVTAPEIDVSSRLGALTTTYVDPTSRLRESCASRAGAGNSFVGVGRGGLPASPQSAAFAAYGSFAPLAALPAGTAAQCPS